MKISRLTPRLALHTAAVASALSAWAYLPLPPAQAAPETQPAAPAAPATAPAAATTMPAAVEPAAPKPQRRPAPETFLTQLRQQRDASRNNYSGFEDAGSCRLDALLRFRMVRGALRVDAADVPAGRQLRLRIEGSDAIWLVFRPQQNVNGLFPNPANVPVTTTVTRVDPGVKDDSESWSTHINVSGANYYIMGQSVLNRVMLNQTNGQIIVNVTEWTTGPQGNAQPDVVLNARAGSLGQLRGEHPEEFRRYVLPLLAKFSDLEWMRPGPADVYAAFGQIPADEQVTRKILTLLPDLDAEPFPVRDAASSQLTALGPAGVLAALRMDWSELTDEQRGRLLAFVNDHHRREYPDAASAAHDLNFLADCLEYDDAAVRAAAAAALEQALGQPIAFEAGLSGKAREAAVDAVRRKIAETPATETPATQPATRAATQPAAGG